MDSWDRREAEEKEDAGLGFDGPAASQEYWVLGMRCYL
jgi:hypothetical protein